MPEISQTTKKIALVLIIIIIIFLLFSRGQKSESEEITIEPRVPEVTLLEIRNSDGTSGSLRLTGEVESTSKAELRAQLSQPVSAIYTFIGDTIYAGETLLTLENASFKATVAGLEAALLAEKAALADMLNGARPEELEVYKAQLSSAMIATQNAESALVDRVRDGITGADDIIHNRLDIFFDNPRDPYPSLIFLPYNSQYKIDLETARPEIEGILHKWKLVVDAGVSSESAYLVPELLADLYFVEDFVNTLAASVNALTPTNAFPAETINAWKATVAGARTQVSGAISALRGSSDAVVLASANVATAQSQLDLALAGASAEQIQIQEARVKGAEANLESARVSLGKTRIVSPITGTVAELPFRQGELVNPGDLLASVVGDAQLFITTFVSPQDTNYIGEGSRVSIEGGYEGVVSYISPSVNTQTKKVEVVIGVVDTNATLINGQFVSLSIGKTSDEIQVPLSAIRNDGQESFVFTLTEENTIVSNPVTVTKVLGDAVIIDGNLHAMTHIIQNVRGLEIGETVTVK